MWKHYNKLSPSFYNKGELTVAVYSCLINLFYLQSEKKAMLYVDTLSAIVLTLIAWVGMNRNMPSGGGVLFSVFP